MTIPVVARAGVLPGASPLAAPSCRSSFLGAHMPPRPAFRPEPQWRRGGDNYRLHCPTRAAAWDPEGLFKTPASGGLIAKQEARRRMRQTGSEDPRTQIVPIPGDLVSNGGADPSSMGAEGHSKETFAATLAEQYMEVDLDHPGLTVLSIDPPVLSVSGFLTQDECDTIMNEVVATGALATSKVGGGNVNDGNALSDRRTSESVMLDAALASSHPPVKSIVELVHAKARKVLPGGAWSTPGALPRPGDYCFELLQAARYEEGQHFLAHEDGFPAELSAENQFQRHATLLCYLNTVEEGKGGCTRFDLLDLAVKPEAGKLLLFFPAFRDGASDPRTLHTAEDAVDTKWVTQQWVACGYGASSAAAAAAAPALPKEEPVVEVVGRRRKGGKGKGKAAAGGAKRRGFGG